MKKLVYNSNTEKLEVLDYETNKVKDVASGEERDVTKDDDFHFVGNSEKIYSNEDEVESKSEELPDEIDLLKLVDPIKGQLIMLVIIICLVFGIAFKMCGSSGNKPGEYEMIVPTDTLPATNSDVIQYIRDYELSNGEFITNWRKKLIVSLATGLRRTRARYIVDSLANDQPTKYKSR